MTRLPSVLRPLFPWVKAGVLRATQAASPITRRLPGDDARPTPPRRSARTAAGYAETHPSGGVQVTEVAPVDVLERPLPAGVPADHPQFTAHRRERVGPNVVATIRNGRVLDHYAAVIAEDDTLLFDLSPYYGVERPSQHPVFLRVRLPEVTAVSGAVGVLTTRGSDNYYHFLTDVLPRLELLRRAGVTPQAFLVNRRTRFQRDLLDHLGLTADHCLGSDKYPHLRADQLVVPSLPDDDLRTPRWIVPWLRAQFLPETVAAPHRRLYVSRGDVRHTRRVNNEAALLAALEPLGFERIDPGALSPAEQVRAFAEAACVVGPHGAGLTNLAFAPAGAAVVELFARDYVNECFWA
ncbi:MAG TPA: glycosyltransferase family 61 protein, partial [Acidimicrobiales bacterium]|nr:glycosyltransferase family 61 protein [Acidimicrobiales bacterium]